MKPSRFIVAGQRLTRPTFVRSFSPDAVDLDHLAEAVRKLLGADAGLSEQSDSDLHSLRTRVSHVLGANGKH